MSNEHTADKVSGGSLLVCTFCGKKQVEVTKLIAGPGVYICNTCVDTCNKLLDGDKSVEQSIISLSPEDPPPNTKCSFCGKRSHQVESILHGAKAHICSECVDLCNEILDEELFASSGTAKDGATAAARPYGKGVREQIFQIIVNQALSGNDWQSTCAGPMQVNNITPEAVESEVRRRLAILGFTLSDSELTPIAQLFTQREQALEEKLQQKLQKEMLEMFNKLSEELDSIKSRLDKLEK